MRGQTVRTPERVAEAIRLREQGWTYRQIGDLMGVSHTTACDWVNDPDGSELRRRHENHRGICVDCGAPTSWGPTTGGYERCRPCAVSNSKIWTRDAIVAAIRAWAEETGGIPPAATDWNPHAAAALSHPRKAERFYGDDAWPYESTVVKTFGTWNAAIRAAGFTPRLVGTYGRDGEDISLCREIAERYLAGETTAELGEAYGCSDTTVAYRLRKVGTAMRPACRRPVAA